MLRGLTKAISNTCGKQQSPGAKAKLYIACGNCDLPNGMPLTRKEIVEAAGGTPVQGDDKIYDQPFDFSGAPVGEGFWRVYDIRVDSGAIEGSLEGDVNLSWTNSIPFAFDGLSAATLSEVDELINHSNCMVAAIELKDNEAYILGSPDKPVKIASGGSLNSGKKSGDPKGVELTLQCEEGVTPMLYAHETHGFDITPN